MEKRIEVCQGGLQAVFEIGSDDKVYLLHFAAVPFHESDILPYQKEKFLLAQMQAVGYDHGEHHGSKHTGNMPGGSLICTGYEDTVNEIGRKLVFYQKAGDVSVEDHIQFYGNLFSGFAAFNLPVIRLITKNMHRSQQRRLRL